MDKNIAKRGLTTFNQNKILNFPDRINITTIFLLILVYVLLLIVIIGLILPKYDYTVEYDYPTGTYNNEINPYTFVRGTAEEVTEESGKKTIKVKHRIIAYIKQMGEIKPTTVRYAYSGLDKEGEMYYFYESNKTGSTLPVTHSVASKPDVYPSQNDFNKYFIKVLYDINSETKVLELSQEVLHLSRFELYSDKFTTNNTNDYVTATFTFKDSTTTQYESYIKIEFKEKTPYVVNMQSWLVTEDNKIYPYLGLYNYSYPDTFYPTSASMVNKYIKPAYIYMKLNFITANNTVNTMYYKASVTELLNK